LPSIRRTIHCGNPGADLYFCEFAVSLLPEVTTFLGVIEIYIWRIPEFGCHSMAGADPAIANVDEPAHR